MVSRYAPPENQLDSLQFVLEADNLVLVTNQSAIPRSLMQPLFNLAFLYAPIAIATDIRDFNAMNHVVAWEAGQPFDTAWALNALSRLEEGWTLQEQKLLSPVPSTLCTGDVVEITIGASQETVAATAAILQRHQHDRLPEEVQVLEARRAQRTAAAESGSKGESAIFQREGADSTPVRWWPLAALGLVSFALGLLANGAF